MTPKTYLGDGVYCEVDGYGNVVLTTGDGICATNTIIFEPAVLAAFEKFISDARAAAAAKKGG